MCKALKRQQAWSEIRGRRFELLRRYGGQDRRLAARRGAKKAAGAVGHASVVAYHLLEDDRADADVGPHYFDQRDRRALQRRLVQRRQGLGYTVTLAPTDPAA